MGQKLLKGKEYYIQFKFAIDKDFSGSKMPEGFGLLKIYHKEKVQTPIFEYNYHSILPKVIKAPSLQPNPTCETDLYLYNIHVASYDPDNE